MTRWVGVLLAACALPLAAAPAPSATVVPDPLLAELEQRLARQGADAVNAHLAAHWESAMWSLNQRTAACELPAVSLSVRLGRSKHTKAVQAHGEALRAASGRCVRFVLAIVSLQEVPRYCGSLSSWGPAQTARELRRRIGEIDADAQLRANDRGRACRAAYVYELENTRVVVKRAAPDAPRAGTSR